MDNMDREDIRTTQEMSENIITSIASCVRTDSDPALFQSEQVLRTLKEGSWDSSEEEQINYWRRGFQPHLRPRMRVEIAEWMLEVCEEEMVQPEIFCLAVNCLDRFLSKVEVQTGQLQLLASACLLIAWKVREHSRITVQRIVKYTNFNITDEELLEWEVLVLAKLNWNIPAVVALDFVEHIMQGISKIHGFSLPPGFSRSQTQSLIFKCHVHHLLALQPPAVVAAASHLVALRPLLSYPRIDTPSTPPSSSSLSSSPECSSPILTSSPFRIPESPIPRANQRTPERNLRRSPRHSKITDLERVTRSVQKITLLNKSVLQQCVDDLEKEVERSILPLSPPMSDDNSDSCESMGGGPSSSGTRFSTSSPLPQAARTLFKEIPNVFKTPTKVLDAAASSAAD